jgi:FKBP-type peptidyl-prolyl cis-trans isomerase (trigger factor)
MKIAELDDNDGMKVLQIEAPWAEIEADYRDLVSQYAKVRLPGFRPGKAPKPVIELRFRKEIIEDLATQITKRFGREAVRETGVETLGSLEVTEIDCTKGQPFRARVSYIPMPDFGLPNLDDLKAKDDGPDARDRISRRLLELVPFEVPDELVRRELDLDGLGEHDPAKEAWRAAAERIRLMIILKKIARQECIKVDERDVNTRIAEKAREFGTSPEALQTELEEGGGMARLQDLLMAESTLDYLIETTRQQQTKGG